MDYITHVIKITTPCCLYHMSNRLQTTFNYGVAMNASSSNRNKRLHNFDRYHGDFICRLQNFIRNFFNRMRGTATYS
jgi:hypothetical protein